MQDDEISGFQIRHKDEWFLVKPIPNAIVVNVGNVLEIVTAVLGLNLLLPYMKAFLSFFLMFLSNGMYKSIEHRTITNEKKEHFHLQQLFFHTMNWKLVLWGHGRWSRPRMYRKIKYLFTWDIHSKVKWRESSSWHSENRKQLILRPYLIVIISLFNS